MNRYMDDFAELDELIALAPNATYGDNVDGTERGQAFHLSSVLPAVSAAIGHPISTRIHNDPQLLQNALGIPDAESAIVVLVDGLGFWNLRLRIGHAPYLRSLLQDSNNNRSIAACLPSTTTAAMGVFGTGTCPGLTGLTGYTQHNPDSGQLCQLIQFRGAQKPEDLQQEPTIFEQLSRQDVRVTSSGLPKFAYSGLSRAALRGAQYIGNNNSQARIRAAAQAAKEPGLTYLYIRDIDKVGHAQGWESEEWVATLERVDAQLSELKRQSPKGTLIVVTADHGMVRADSHQRFDLAEHKDLQKGVRLVGGEPRQVMLYLDHAEEAIGVAERWQDRLGDRCLVRTKEEVISSGVLGVVDERIRPIIGDIFISSQRTTTVVDSRTQGAQEISLPGVHGSQTYLESDIPCLIDMA